MTQTLFDTHAFVRRLEGVAFSADQAEAMARALQDALNDGVAMKSDVGSLRTDVRDDLRALEHKIALSEKNMTTKFVTMLAVAVGVILAGFRLIGAG